MGKPAPVAKDLINRIMDDVESDPAIVATRNEMERVDAAAAILVASGMKVRCAYSTHFGIYFTVSIKEGVKFEDSDEGALGQAYAERILNCAEYLLKLKEHVPEGVLLGNGGLLEIAKAYLLLNFMDSYVSRREDDEENEENAESGEKGEAENTST